MTTAPLPRPSRRPTLSRRGFPACGLAAAALMGLLLAAPAPGAAQELRLPTGQMDQRVDRIAAVVGDSIIFMTDLEEQFIREAAQGREIPTDPQAREELRRSFLDRLVNEQLLLQAAARDTTVTVSDDRVESTLRGEWDEQIRRWGSEAALREELNRSQGLSLTQYRAQLREEIRRQLLIQSFLQARRREARPVSVSDAEVDAYFERQRAVLQRRPATITFRQVFVQPMPGDSAMTAAKEEIERLLEQVRAGEDFASLARQFSEDPGSRTQGGDLGWYRRGDGLVREFEDAAFGVREGAIVGPVETQFGAHLIQVERVRGAERKIRHILIGAEVTDEDLVAARSRAEEVRTRLAEGAPIREFTERQRGQQIPDSVEVPLDQLRQLPEALGQQLMGAAEGDVVGPVEFPLGAGQPAWAVFRVVQVRGEGEYTVDDLRSQIRQLLQQEKAEARMLEDLRARTYVDIRI
jgi:peptidyl-prolyl cis-trans isomerase SurA